MTAYGFYVVNFDGTVVNGPWRDHQTAMKIKHKLQRRTANRLRVEERPAPIFDVDVWSERGMLFR